MREIVLNRSHPLCRRACAWWIADRGTAPRFRELVNNAPLTPGGSQANYSGHSRRYWTQIGSFDFATNSTYAPWTSTVYMPRGAHSFILTGSFRGTSGSTWAAFRDSADMGIYVAGAPTKWYIHTSGLWLIDTATTVYTGAVGPEVGFHIAVTIDGTGGSSSRKGYTDGKLFGSDNTNSWSGGGGTRTVYLAGDAYSQPWAGSIESIRYYDGVLSAEEVAMDYREHLLGYPGMLKTTIDNMFLAALGGAEQGVDSLLPCAGRRNLVQELIR